MSGFSEESMSERLRRLTSACQSVQTLSMWIIHHQKKHADDILSTWLKEVTSNTSPDKLISLVYLANDVIQNCRKKNPQFMKSFFSVLQPAFNHISEVGDEKVLGSVSRIIHVWKERMIYTADEIESLSDCILRPGVQSPSFPVNSNAAGGGANLDDPSTTPPPSQSPTTSTTKKAEHREDEDPASADAKIRQLISVYPESIANPELRQIKTMEQAQELMDKINEAGPIVNAYCSRLKTELTDRRTAQRLLDDYLQALNDSSERNKKLMSSVRKQIDHIDHEKKEMTKHIENLPDLNEVEIKESTTALPSLGELFT
uniref:CID domain-containing protein n=1 Tax=Ditylenchus dipsaci TaxID=166011 RepID=A0A915CNX7_9BILA